MPPTIYSLYSLSIPEHSLSQRFRWKHNKNCPFCHTFPEHFRDRLCGKILCQTKKMLKYPPKRPSRGFPPVICFAAIQHDTRRTRRCHPELFVSGSILQRDAEISPKGPSRGFPPVICFAAIQHDTQHRCWNKFSMTHDTQGGVTLNFLFQGLS